MPWQNKMAGFLMNDKSTLRDDAGCFFVASWKKRYFLQEKVLKKRYF